MLQKLLGGGVAAVLDSVKGVAEVFKGNETARDAQDAGQNIATTSQFAAEFQNAPTSRWDSFVNGLNRLPRPMMVFGVLGLMAWCPYDPTAFSEAMAAFALVPEWLAWTFGSIVLFYFGTRHREQLAKMKGPALEQVKAYAEAVAALKKAAPPKPLSEAEYQRQMADQKNPLSNEALAEWNRRRNMKPAV